MPVLYTVYANASNACSIHGLHECFEYLFVLYTMLYTRASSAQRNSSACSIHGLHKSLAYLEKLECLPYTMLYISTSSAQRNSQGQNRQNTSSKSIQKIIDQKIWIEYYFLHTKSVQKINKITKSRMALDVHSLSQVHVHKRAPISHWTI